MAKLSEFGPKPRADLPPLMKASDLKAPVIYTITAMEVRNLKGEMKPVASFAETKMQWVVNKTNMASLAKQFGDIELTEMKGRKVQLAKVSTGSRDPDMSEGIRIIDFPA